MAGSVQQIGAGDAGGIAPACAAPKPRIEIRPKRVLAWADVAELWEYRDLLWMLTKRNVQIKYKQTAIGALWIVLQPIVTIAIFGTLFQLLQAKPVASGVPYVVTTYVALLPWQFFATGVTMSSTSLVTNQAMVTKVYFPRLMLPGSAVMSALVDFAVALVVLFVLMAIYQVPLSWPILTLPLFIGLAFAAALAAGIWISALNAMYRDFQHIVPFALQAGMFVSPVVYEAGAIVPERFMWLYGLNPMVGVIDGFRWACLGGAAPLSASIVPSMLIVAGLLITGIVHFRRLERTFVDWV